MKKILIGALGATIGWTAAWVISLIIDAKYDKKIMRIEYNDGFNRGYVVGKAETELKYILEEMNNKESKEEVEETN